MRQVRVSKAEPLKLFAKYSHREEEARSVIDIGKRTKGRTVNLGTVEREMLYPDGRCITKAKKDLMSILKFIPQVHHSFYQNIHAINDSANDTESVEDIDGLPSELDFEVEAAAE